MTLFNRYSWNFQLTKCIVAAENGFNPVWNETCEFTIRNSHLAMLRFEVQDEDMFGEPNFIGQATFPLNCIRLGYRSVPLHNKHSENIELASLLVHVSIRNVLLKEPFNYF